MTGRLARRWLPGGPAAALLVGMVLGALPAIPRARAEAPADPAAAGRMRYGPALTAEAARLGLPAALADAVATVESGYDPASIGGDGEIGLMQVMPATAEMLGFHGTRVALADPQTNIRLGVAYLAGAWAATGGRLCDTLAKYRAGYGVQSMTLRSVVYCRRARDYLAAIGSPLANGPGTEIPPITPEMIAADAAANVARWGRRPELMTAAEIARLHAGHRTAEDSRRFWLAEEAYIRRLRATAAVRRLMSNR